jgi:peroxiredoxin
MVAISPQTPDYTASTAREKDLGLPVLSDVGNHVAREYGLVFVLSDALQNLQKKFGNEVPASTANNRGSYQCRPRSSSHGMGSSARVC